MQQSQYSQDAALAPTYTAAARKQPSRRGPTGRAPKARLRQLKAAREEGLIDDATYAVTQRAVAAELAGVSFKTTCVVTHTNGSVVHTTATTHNTAQPAQRDTATAATIQRGIAPPHDLEGTIARLSSPRVDVRVHDTAVIDHCIARLLETDDGGEACIDKQLAEGCNILEVPLTAIGLEPWIKEPDPDYAEEGDEAEERTTCDYIVPPACVGADLDDRVLFLHGGVYIYYSPSNGYRPLATRLAAAIGMPVFVPDYRKAPEFQHPAAVLDSVAALQYIAQY